MDDNIYCTNACARKQHCQTSKVKHVNTTSSYQLIPIVNRNQKNLKQFFHCETGINSARAELNTSTTFIPWRCFFFSFFFFLFSWHCSRCFLVSAWLPEYITACRLVDHNRDQVHARPKKTCVTIAGRTANFCHYCRDDKPYQTNRCLHRSPEVQPRPSAHVCRGYTMYCSLWETGTALCASDVHLHDVHLMCIWCASDVHLMCTWCASDVHLMCTATGSFLRLGQSASYYPCSR